jgi:hypothetical protein
MVALTVFDIAASKIILGNSLYGFRGLAMSYMQILPAIFALVAITALACSSGVNWPVVAPAPQIPTAATEAEQVSEQTSTPVSARPPADISTEPTPTPPAAPSASQSSDVPPRFRSYWKTDFSKHSIPLEEIVSGGPQRDGIPPIDSPQYASVSEPPSYMSDDEPVVTLEIDGDARAYPLAILMWHEIVNDEVGGIPVTVTYCPLCNTAITFDRRVGDRVLDFGTSGLLRNSDLVMWDRQTESWWQQITGEAIVGELTGTRLEFIPSPIVSWKDFFDAYPDGQVLTRDTGVSRDYNLPPYAGYDTLDNTPFLFYGGIDSRLEAMERIIGLTISNDDVAYSFQLLKDHPVVQDTVGGREVVIFYSGGTRSAFAGPGNSESRAVGSTGVFEPVLDGQKLTFKSADGAIVDEETGSEWNILGQAVSGPMEGNELTPVVHANHFWFAWQAFNPDTAVRTADDLS